MKERAFGINKPKIIQQEVFAKEQNAVQLPSEIKKIYSNNNSNSRS